MWIKREIEDNLLVLATQRPAVVLTGARQTGKTSLLSHLFNNHHFVSMDYLADARFAEEDTLAFFKKNPPPVILDEIQYVPDIFKHLKIQIDKNRKTYGQYLMTGSQNFLLLKGVTESLAGRVGILELENLSYYEINQALKEIRLEEIILKGGFPELYSNPNLDRQNYLKSYLMTYLEKDLRSILNINNLRDFDRFIRACALRSAQLLNKADIAKDVGVSPTTANEWLSVLQGSGHVVLLEPWFSNKSKSIIKSPKIYLADVGLLLFLLNIHTEEDLLKSPYIGAIWETFIFSELRKRQTAKNGHWNIHFIRDRAKEVDFVISKGGNFELIECKWSESPNSGDRTQLMYFENFLGKKNVHKKSIISRTNNPRALEDGTRIENIKSFQWA